MDFELIYIGAGFITPLAVNVSMMIGAILSWGIAWPLLENRAGDWYPLGLASHSFRGLFACAFLSLPARCHFCCCPCTCLCRNAPPCLVQMTWGGHQISSGVLAARPALLEHGSYACAKAL